MHAGDVAVSLSCNHYLFGLTSPYQNFVTGHKTNNYTTSGQNSREKASKDKKSMAKFARASLGYRNMNLLVILKHMK